MRLLFIEDDRKLAETVSDELKKDHLVEVSFDGNEGLKAALKKDYDLILLDLYLPGKNGIRICKALRKKGINIPIIILTGEDNINKKVTSLDCGADDYLIKPFKFPELKARIRALLRRIHKDNPSKILYLDDLTLDLDKMVVKRGNKELTLRRKEMAILTYLMRNPGKVITRDMILDHVWNKYSESLHNIVDVHIKYLRDNIDRKFDKKLIKTVYGVGYKIEGKTSGILNIKKGGEHNVKTSRKSLN